MVILARSEARWMDRANHRLGFCNGSSAVLFLVAGFLKSVLSVRFVLVVRSCSRSFLVSVSHAGWLRVLPSSRQAYCQSRPASCEWRDRVHTGAHTGTLASRTV